MARHSRVQEQQRYGKLTVFSREGTTASGHALWGCICDCKQPRLVSSKALLAVLDGHPEYGTSSCGKCQPDETDFEEIVL